MDTKQVGGKEEKLYIKELRTKKEDEEIEAYPKPKFI